MNIKKKFFRVTSSLALALCIVSIPTIVSAGSISETYSGQFRDDWSLTLYGDSDQAKLEYGFNTWAWNEDTAHAYHTSASHYAKIKNGNGTHTSTSKYGGSWSKCEVKHAGSEVTYYCEW